MRHLEAIEYLPEQGSGLLDPAAEEELLLHAEQCEECSDWLLTRDLLAHAFGAGPEDHAEHPGSELLALCVIRPEEVHEPDREEVRMHIERCEVCRQELDLARSAVLQGRPLGEAPREQTSGALQPRLLLRTGPAIAAGLALALLGASLFIGGVLVGRMDSTEPRPGALSIVSERIGDAEELSGGDLDGTQVLGAERRLVVSKLTVRSGADVTFQAGETVAFGDGFRVLSGARIRVASMGSDPGGASAPKLEQPVSARGAPDRDTERSEIQ